MSVFYRQIRSMGTLLDIILPDTGEGKGLSIIRDINEELGILVQQISNYNKDSALSRLNRLAFKQEIEMDGYLKDLISEGMRYYDLTYGLYDFTLGAWTSKPDLVRDTGSKFQALKNTPYKNRILVDDCKIKFLQEDLRIDSGGIGKGMALKAIEKILLSKDIHSAFISFGGSSIIGIGKHPYGDSWKVGIQDPEKEGKTISELSLMNNSLSISGNSSNNRKKYGEEGHILNPKDGRFYTNSDIVAVISKDPVQAEVLSTAVLLADKETEKQIRERFPDEEILRFVINN